MSTNNRTILRENKRPHFNNKKAFLLTMMTDPKLNYIVKRYLKYLLERSRFLTTYH